MRVAVEYVLVAAGLLLTLGMVEARFGLPDWTLRKVAAISSFALPFLLVLIWALEDHGPQRARVRGRPPRGPSALGAQGIESLEAIAGRTIVPGAAVATGARPADPLLAHESFQRQLAGCGMCPIGGRSWR